LYGWVDATFQLTNLGVNTLDLYPLQEASPAIVDFSSRFPASDFETTDQHFAPDPSKSTLP